MNEGLLPACGPHTDNKHIASCDATYHAIERAIYAALAYAARTRYFMLRGDAYTTRTRYFSRRFFVLKPIVIKPKADAKKPAAASAFVGSDVCARCFAERAAFPAA